VKDDPTAVRLDLKTNCLSITWADGHESAYDGGYLRMICPCAMCRGHAPGEVEPPTWEACKDTRATNVTLVGSYALRIDLSDGHGTGIYSFAWLRERCPCCVGGDLGPTGRPCA
jgi:DUF971 family protein